MGDFSTSERDAPPLARGQGVFDGPEVDVDPLDRDDLYWLLALYLWGTATIVGVMGLYGALRYFSLDSLSGQDWFIVWVSVVGLLAHPPAFWILRRLSRKGLRDFGFGLLLFTSFLLAGIIYLCGIHTAVTSVLLFGQLGLGTVILDRRRILILIATMLGNLYLIIFLTKTGIIPYMDFGARVLDFRQGAIETFALVALFTGTVLAVYFWTMYVRERLEKAHRDLAVLAATDKLTGLPNRRSFDEALSREVLRAMRTDRPLALLMCDVDHFKKVNDTHGHTAGDEVLRRIAAVLLGSVRIGVDTPSRFGGEEFAILLPETELKGAREVAQRIADAVRMLQFGGGGKQFSVTISIGVGVLRGENLDGETLLELSDTLLYRAKKGGRDRVVAGEIKDLPSG